MDRWDIFIILAAGYVAVMTLVRLMTARRNQLVNQIRGQLEEQRKRKRAAAERAAEAKDRDVA